MSVTAVDGARLLGHLAGLAWLYAEPVYRESVDRQLVELLAVAALDVFFMNARNTVRAAA